MIDLHTFASANGYRAAIMLEETGLPYTAYTIDLQKGEHKAPAYLAINPLGLIPAIVDRDTGGEPISIGENLAIALYLSEKSGLLAPKSAAGRARAWQWAAAGVSGFGPAMFGIYLARSLGAEAHAPLIGKYFDKVKANFAAMDATLATQHYLAGDDYSYADVLLVPFATLSAPAYGIDLSEWPHLVRWRDEVAARPAVMKGMAVPYAK